MLALVFCFLFISIYWKKLPVSSVYKLQCLNDIHEWQLMCKDFEGTDRNLVVALTQNLPGGIVDIA
jgi:hypothetical protein